MVSHILVSQCQGKDALGYQPSTVCWIRLWLRLSVKRPGEAGDDAKAFLDLAQKNDAGVRRDRSAVESCFDPSAPVGLKGDRFPITIYSHEVFSQFAAIRLKPKGYWHGIRPCTILTVKYPG